ncbi:MAG: AAA family ATPase, partial [Deltaproteobacteria bacterium]|nr:AAA family ATPase [Deltaproteobacteria bacterium]
MKEIPIGIADFFEIRQENYFYADKTESLYNLLGGETPYFLSRPRRFGKTLLVSALEAILEGRRELFKGLWIDSSDYDWTPNPVVHLSLTSIVTTSVEDLNRDLSAYLQNIAKLAGLTIYETNPTTFFRTLITDLYLKYNRKVAVLIDEYDAPILAQIERPELAKEIRDATSSFYAVLKNVEKYRGFTFITGVTKFSKTSIFSSLNNFEDLTLDKNYATICG